MIRLFRLSDAAPARPERPTLPVPGGGRFGNADLPYVSYRAADDDGSLSAKLLPDADRPGAACLGNFPTAAIAREVIARAAGCRRDHPVAQQLAESGFGRDGQRFVKTTPAGIVLIEQSLRGARVLFTRETFRTPTALMTIQARDPEDGQQLWPPYMMSERNQIAAMLWYVGELERTRATAHPGFLEDL